MEFFSFNLRFLNHYENKHMGILTEELTKLIVAEIIGIRCCVAACDGHKVHDRIAAAFNESRKIEISFAGTSDITPAFLNSAVGQLYETFPIELIESNLFFTDISDEDEIILKRVLERAKTYSENACSCKKALSDVLGGEDA
jgi:hypothetical protein